MTVATVPSRASTDDQLQGHHLQRRKPQGGCSHAAAAKKTRRCEAIASKDQGQEEVALGSSRRGTRRGQPPDAEAWAARRWPCHRPWMKAKAISTTRARPRPRPPMGKGKGRRRQRRNARGCRPWRRVKAAASKGGRQRAATAPEHAKKLMPTNPEGERLLAPK